MSKKIVIIDYGMGNLYSVANACTSIGLDFEISDNPKLLDIADGIILPGVGAFGDAMMRLDELGFSNAIREYGSSGRKILGICLGMQLLMDVSEEFGEHAGLGLLKGNVKKFPHREDGARYKIPQIQWNKVARVGESKIIRNLPESPFFYFLHSFYVNPSDPRDVAGVSTYCQTKYCSIIEKDNIVGTQFHPERSGLVGLKLISNFKATL